MSTQSNSEKIKKEKDDIKEGIVSRLSFNKKITIEADDKVYNSKDALPGERVLFRKRRKSVEIIEIKSSPYIKNINCPVQDRCGGCRFRELDYLDEYTIKDMELKRLSDELNCEYLGLYTPTATEGYRNKMEYTFGDEIKGGSLKLGLHEKGKFHNIIEYDNCRLVPKNMDRIKKSIREFAENSGYNFYHRFNNSGYFRHLVIRHSLYEDKYLLNIVTTSSGELDLDQLIAKLKEDKLLPIIKGIYHTINDAVSDAIVVDKIELIYGEADLIEKLDDKLFPIGPLSFFQTNTIAADELYKYVREIVEEADELWDLYAGSAIIGALLSDKANKIYSVEINPANILDAKKMLELNDIKNVTPVLADCKDFVLKEDKADFIIVDPPRTGLHPKVVDAINNSHVDKIIYVSCNPVTAVSNMIMMDNYRVLNLKGFDNFRATLNVEIVLILEKIK
ncbi:MAG: 23S rRNA (uracil(1939)-C(5))-methyltransferase RlmD [Firmicutes bacterium]|nr:23S rRNA (uracil(1939)-C(5))-methyltransferase RlmD [Bacillota bacterium]